MSDFFGGVTWRTARKNHRCSTCHRVIDVGEKYRHQNGNYDGRWYTFAMCQHCEAIWSLYRPEDYDGNISEEGFDNWAMEGSSEEDPGLPHETQLRHRVQYRKGWRRDDGALFPRPTPTESEKETKA